MLDTIDYRLTVEDPATWVRPWTVAFPLVKTDSRIYQYACHEGNYNMLHILSAARSMTAKGESTTNATSCHGVKIRATNPLRWCKIQAREGLAWVVSARNGLGLGLLGRHRIACWVPEPHRPMPTMCPLALRPVAHTSPGRRPSEVVGPGSCRIPPANVDERVLSDASSQR